jgi:2-polyprenyl-3-methyl-5-hydroxy-6-metoxy-1,4-benzoquinol methylase
MASQNRTPLPGQPRFSAAPPWGAKEKTLTLAHQRPRLALSGLREACHHVTATSDIVHLERLAVLRKLAKLYRGVGAWADQSTSRVDLQVADITLSPIEKYLLHTKLSETRGLFHSSYDEWRVRRCAKILEIYGVEYFRNRKILEVGGGHGDIGAFFAELGADVLCVDGRIRNLNFAKLKHRNVPNLRFELLNLERGIETLGRFDLIIHFGLLYHLKDIEGHLGSCFNAADDLVLETVVCDSTSPDTIFFCDEDKKVDEEALEGAGNRPSPFYVERVIERSGFKFTRYLDADLNVGDWFLYDWPHKNDNSGRDGSDFWLRRFWRLQKTAV